MALESNGGSALLLRLFESSFFNVDLAIGESSTFLPTSSTRCFWHAVTKACWLAVPEVQDADLSSLVRVALHAPCSLVSSISFLQCLSTLHARLEPPLFDGRTHHKRVAVPPVASWQSFAFRMVHDSRNPTARDRAVREYESRNGLPACGN